VFLQTEVAPKQIMDKLGSALRGTRHIYSILHYGNDKKDIVVRNNERQHWARLFDSKFFVLASMGFIEGDEIVITSGALKGLESQTIKINRHQRRAVVEMEMMGATRQVTLMLEIASVKG
jgi:transcriptional antiterminator NusG